jgi:hypothetical protein
MNGNTYHSVNVTDVSTGFTIYCPYQYGYGDHYRQTALVAMYKEMWINNVDYTDDILMIAVEVARRVFLCLNVKTIIPSCGMSQTD